MGEWTNGGGASSAVASFRLVERAKAGRLDAVEALYREHSGRIYGYLSATVGNPEDAEDLTIQTFVRMLESLERFETGSSPFAAWLYRIARNLAVDHFRASVRARERTARLAPSYGRAASAEEQALVDLERQGVRDQIASLPTTQREVLTLKFVCGLSNAEAALVLAKTEGAVKALQHRALVTLQQRASVAA
jgi:RNA polymerase sigma-70 factor (ECF subfamily)